MKNKYILLKLGCFLAGLLLMASGLVAQILRVFNIGSFLLCLCGAVLLCGGIAVWLKPENKKIKICVTVMFFMIIIFLSGYALILNHYANHRQPDEEGEAVVVVLGCKINDDKPSLMLRRRLDTAVTYLNTNPNAVCVVSGGVGEDEKYSEAEVMAKYLIEQGIKKERIFKEEYSVNTKTNLENSIKLAEEKNLTGEFIICTDGFHQLRAALYARQYGKEAKAISSKTPPLVWPSYAMREFGGILRMLVLPS